MSNRTLSATVALCVAIVSPAFAGGHGDHHQNMGHAFKGGNFNFNDERLLQTIAKDERSQLFSDANVAKTKGGNQVTWTNSGPDCLIAPVQASNSTASGNASKSKGLFHHSNQVIRANSGPDCLVAPVQASRSVASGNASKGIFHRNNQAIWTNSGPDCLVAPVQTSESINGGNASKSPRHEKSNGRGAGKH